MLKLLFSLVLLLIACGPTGICTATCGVSYDGKDCSTFSATISAEMSAYPMCTTSTTQYACESLNGYVVHILPESDTYLTRDGHRAWHPRTPEEEDAMCRETGRCDGGGDIYGFTDCIHHTITLAEENWSDGVAAWELVNASQGFCPNISYDLWDSYGFSCVYDAGRSAQTQLTGSAGGN